MTRRNSVAAAGLLIVAAVFAGALYAGRLKADEPAVPKNAVPKDTAASQTSAEQIKQLQSRIAALEERIAALEKRPAPIFLSPTAAPGFSPSVPSPNGTEGEDDGFPRARFLLISNKATQWQGDGH